MAAIGSPGPRLITAVVLLLTCSASMKGASTDDGRQTSARPLQHVGLADAKGKPRYRFHDLRHTCISRLVAAIKLVQQVAGHANPLITLTRYSHLLEQRITEAAERHDPLRSLSSRVGTPTDRDLDAD